MKKIITFIVVAIFALTVEAQQFKILHLTTPDVTIGGKSLKIGDVFDGKAKIEWSAPRQAMKVLNTATKEQSLVVAEKYNQRKSKDIASYLVSSKQLSTRRGELINTMELGMALGDTFYLLDSLRIESKLPVDAKRFFFATFDYDGELINKKLQNDADGAIIFDRQLFSVDGKPIEPFDVPLTIYYLDQISGTKTLITDSMLLLPL